MCRASHFWACACAAHSVFRCTLLAAASHRRQPTQPTTMSGRGKGQCAVFVCVRVCVLGLPLGLRAALARASARRAVRASESAERERESNCAVLCALCVLHELAVCRRRLIVCVCAYMPVCAGGKGLGKGGAKRHRKVLRDNIQVCALCSVLCLFVCLLHMQVLTACLFARLHRASPSPRSDVSHDAAA